jgi:hypothetical protein
MANLMSSPEIPQVYSLLRSGKQMSEDTRLYPNLQPISNGQLGPEIVRGLMTEIAVRRKLKCLPDRLINNSAIRADMNTE